ncbi:hypothetical protein H4S00_006933 [Coemansia sp. D1744]|nr:hypothetical protein H4S00_006933 [Coemansia sp. D1744]
MQRIIRVSMVAWIGGSRRSMVMGSRYMSTKNDNVAIEPESLHTGLSEIEAARHHEQSVARDAALAATFGSVRVLPASSKTRIHEMHSD